jgi:hypothetical protein
MIASQSATGGARTAFSAPPDRRWWAKHRVTSRDHGQCRFVGDGTFLHESKVIAERARAGTLRPGV